jgi:ABC-2 type transport system ATP-binding protein
VAPDQADAAKAAGPVFSETRFGQTVMVYDGGDREALAALGTVTTPTLSDLFVALMTREQGAH